jgi:hypothetical protein
MSSPGPGIEPGDLMSYGTSITDEERSIDVLNSNWLHSPHWFPILKLNDLLDAVEISAPPPSRT